MAIFNNLRARRGLFVFLKSIKFEHTIFALPFAYLALFLVEEGMPSPGNFIWITLAMVGARTFGMGINRIIDTEIDARNPRTRGRALPAGLMSRAEAVLFTLLALGIFIAATSQLSVLSRYLLPAVVIPMVFYPYAKRFTWAGHLILGLVYVMVPTGVWIAVTGELTLASVLIGIGAGFWVAGFDIFYACQDVEVDRQQGIHSIPADFGLSGGFLAARVFHLITIVSLTVAGVLLEASYLYYTGLVVFLILLIYEHRLISPNNLSRLNESFFTMNGIISVSFFLFVAADTLVR